MEFINRTRSLENYTIREVEKSLLVDNGHKGLSADTTNYTFYKHTLITEYTTGDNNYGEYVNTVNEINEDTTSDGILYGKVLDIKTDRKGNPLLDNNNKRIPNTIDVDVFLTQTYDDMGMFTDMDYVPFDINSILETGTTPLGGRDDYLTTYLPYELFESNDNNSFLKIRPGESLDSDYKQTQLQKPNPFNPFIDGRHPKAIDSDYGQSGINVTGETDDKKLLRVASYVKNQSGTENYNHTVNMARDIHYTFDGVISDSQSETKYIIGGSVDSNGNYIPGSGIEYITFKNIVVRPLENSRTFWYKTIFKHTSGGRRVNPTALLLENMSLSAITKDEEYLGVVFPPEVENNVFIIRGGEDIFERHSIMSELKTRSDIDDYRDNYF